MTLDTQGLIELLQLPQLPDDFEITVELRIRAGDLRRARETSGGEVSRDLNISEMATVARRAESTVRGWLREGVTYAYKLNGRDWFCPPDAWAAELRRRGAGGGAGEGAEKTPAPERKRTRALGRAKPVDLGGWREELESAPAARGGKKR